MERVEGNNQGLGGTNDCYTRKTQYFKARIP